MSEEVEVVEGGDGGTVIIEAPVEAVEEAPELLHRYQPTDDMGRPIGGEQVLKYRTTDELISKIQEQNVLLTRKLREVTRKNRLGISDKETIPEDAQRFQNPVDFTPRELSPEELNKLSRDLLDPERFAEAKDLLFEAQTGVKPGAFRDTLKEMQEEVLKFKAKQGVDAFLLNNPGYYQCRENFEAITNWMMKNDLAPVYHNFQLAYDTLRGTGNVIIEAGPILVPPPPPVVAPEATVEPVVEPVVEPTHKPTPLPSGLTRSKAGDQGTPRPLGDDIVFEIVNPYTKERTTYKGLAAINAMSGEEYKRRVNSDPNFTKLEAKLEAEAARGKTSRPGGTGIL
jgi:hypothetical protein